VVALAVVVLSKERQRVLATPCGTLLCGVGRLLLRLLRQQQQRRLHQRQVVESVTHAGVALLSRCVAVL
jgi:hypothetical protein